jgi:class 3 adenylate cyclase
VGGLAVHEAARVASAAKSGEVFVLATAKLLPTGYDLAFEFTGMHELKGVGETYELFRLIEFAG